jgi:hypothetical protein
MTPQIFYLFFKYECKKYAQFYADFKSVKMIGKNHPEKDICQKLLKVSSIKTTPYIAPFFVSKFFTFFSMVLALNSAVF